MPAVSNESGIEKKFTNHPRQMVIGPEHSILMFSGVGKFFEMELPVSLMNHDSMRLMTGTRFIRSFQ